MMKSKMLMIWPFSLNLCLWFHYLYDCISCSRLNLFCYLNEQIKFYYLSEQINSTAYELHSDEI